MESVIGWLAWYRSSLPPTEELKEDNSGEANATVFPVLGGEGPIKGESVSEATDGHKRSFDEDITDLEIKPQNITSGSPLALQEEGEAITQEYVAGTSEASGPELNLVFPKCSEVSEQEKTGDRGNKVPFSPIENIHGDLISNEKCCADAVSNGSPSVANMSFLTGHMGSVSVPAHHVFDENPQLVSDEGTGEAVSHCDILVDGSEGHCDNVKESGKMVLSSDGMKSVTVQGESLNQDRMSQDVAAASKPIAAASLPRSWAHVAAPNGYPGPFVGEDREDTHSDSSNSSDSSSWVCVRKRRKGGKAKRTSGSRVVGGKFPSDSDRFRAPRDPHPKVNGPRQVTKLWVPSSTLSAGVFSRQRSDMFSHGDALSAAQSARAPVYVWDTLLLEPGPGDLRSSPNTTCASR
ncbi:hypothetical protein U1Q18_000637 [Sarracenia purpurea var. burkii]